MPWLILGTNVKTVNVHHCLCPIFGNNHIISGSQPSLKLIGVDQLPSC